MTVSSSTTRALYSGNGATTTFAVPFTFSANSEVIVILRSTAGVETVQTGSGTHYTITGTNVVMVTAPASGEKLLVIRDIDFLQSTDLSVGGTYFAADFEAQLDKATKQIQQLKEILERVPVIKRSTASAYRSLEFPEPDTAYTLLAVDASNLLHFIAPEDALDLPIRRRRSGTQACSLNDTSRAVTFSSVMSSADYVVTAAFFVNTTDASPIFQPVTITARSTSGMTVSWNAALDSANYVLHYCVEDSV